MLPDYKVERRSRRGQRSARRRSVRTFGFIMAIPLVLALTAALLLTGGDSRSDLTQAQLTSAHDQMTGLEAERKRLLDAAREGKREEFTVRVSQDVINVKLSEDLKLVMAFQDRGIEDPFVEISDGKLKATGTKRLGGLGVKVSASLIPVVGADGKLHIQVVGASLGRIGLPSSTVQKLGDSVATRLTDSIGADNITLHSVKIDGDEVILSGIAG